MTIGKKIRKLRLNAGMTQEVLADKLGVRVAYISVWENDHFRPSIESLKNLAKVFGITIDELVN